MIDKLNLLNKAFPSTILKKHKINKNKQKAFILFCEDNKLNWILFRNIIVRAHYHFHLDPILFLTDSVGFNDLDSMDFQFNPYNPTFNILTDIDLDIQNEKYIHQDLLALQYIVWWEGLKTIQEANTNLFLFTDNIEELTKMTEYINKNNYEIIVFDLQLYKNNKNDNILNKFETWRIKTSKKILKKWAEKNTREIIKENINFRKEKRLRRLRNKIFIIMNSYYKNPIVPSYYNDEEKYLQEDFNNKLDIDLLYD